MITLQTYSDLIYEGGRGAGRAWPTEDPHAAVAATLQHDADAIVFAVSDDYGYRIYRGLLPGGLAVGF